MTLEIIKVYHQIHLFLEKKLESTLTAFQLTSFKRQSTKQSKTWIHEKQSNIWIADPIFGSLLNHPIIGL